MPISDQNPGLLHKSLVQTIVENIINRILSGELQPGERLTEQMMCDVLEVSRSPLREAFRILENQGFLVNRARKGVFVPKLTRKEAIDIYTIRANLESLATFLAVKEKGIKLAQELRVIHEKMKKAATNEDTKEYWLYNVQFHETLISSCGNKLLIEMLERFDKQTMRYRVKILANPGRSEKSLKKHEELIRSIEKGDAASAEVIRKKAILDNMALVEKTFEDEEEEGQK
ncbi:MAG: GntR family transcriptional regulator [Synergistaceae bacterium]|jgi:DNA-binding GntR family transcriptional regulator|nr:GntR family transcriptional regulator [Synergistaceae bacterium]